MPILKACEIHHLSYNSSTPRRIALQAHSPPCTPAHSPAHTRTCLVHCGRPNAVTPPTTADSAALSRCGFVNAERVGASPASLADAAFLARFAFCRSFFAFFAFFESASPSFLTGGGSGGLQRRRGCRMGMRWGHEPNWVKVATQLHGHEVHQKPTQATRNSPLAKCTQNH
jgi:hypothetical protein